MMRKLFKEGYCMRKYGMSFIEATKMAYDLALVSSSELNALSREVGGNILCFGLPINA